MNYFDYSEAEKRLRDTVRRTICARTSPERIGRLRNVIYCRGGADEKGWFVRIVTDGRIDIGAPVKLQATNVLATRRVRISSGGKYSRRYTF